jgi:hypothetical protein
MANWNPEILKRVLLGNGYWGIGKMKNTKIKGLTPDPILLRYAIIRAPEMFRGRVTI